MAETLEVELSKIQNRPRAALLVAGLWFLGTGAASAANSANQTVTMQVTAINELAVSGNLSLTVNTAVAGAAPSDAVDSATSYSVTTNETNKKITGAIDSALPTGVTLKANLNAPTGGTSAGAVSLGTTASNLVTGITKVASSGLQISYTLSATVAAGTVSATNRTVTLTLTDG